MAATVLTLAFTVIVSGIVWLALGSRLALAADTRQNEVLNFLCYAALVLPFALAIVVFVIGRI
jgi:hypothetical protein